MNENHTKPDFWEDGKAYLSERDPIMAKIIAAYPHADEYLRSRGDAFYTLARSIVGQQISVKAADSVWNKVDKAVKCITPQHILASSEEDLRSAGLSRQKVAYMRSLSEFFVEKSPDNAFWGNLSDEDIIKELTTIKGIGVWTAEMFLIFYALRPDVFSLGDIGLLKAIELHYGEDAAHAASGKKKYANKPYFKEISDSWAPYRTVASWYLWRSLDPVPVAY